MTLKSRIIGKDSSLLNHSEHHDFRYFAMLNAAVALAGNSKLAGGSPSEAFAYYNYLLASELPDDAPRSLQLTTNDKQLAALKTCMTNLINIYNLLVENFVLSGISTNDLMSSQLQTVLTVIKQNIKEAGVCYFPSGFTGKPGHFAGLKIKQLLNRKYIFSLINHGGGMQYHRELTQSGRKKKCCYQSDAYEIDLNSKNGQELLQRVIELCFDSRKASDSEKIVNPYSADDLYGLLKLYGDEFPWVDKINEKSVTAQRTGSCTVTNVHAIARDILIDNDADFKTRKRYHFVLKLRSLIATFEEYKQNKYSHSVVFWALQEFSVRLNKQYGDILSDEEMIYCAQLQTQIQERLKNDEQGALEKKCAVEPLPSFEGLAPKHEPSIFELTTEKDVGKKEPELGGEASERSFVSTSIKSVNILELIYSYNSLPPRKKYELFNSLPHCSGLAKDTFWDQVPREKISSIITALSYIIKKLQSSLAISSPQERARAFAMALIAYDIAAQLAPRYKGYINKNHNSQLRRYSQEDGFRLGDKYAFALDNVYSEQCFFTDPIAYYTVKRIVENFERRAKNKERILSNAVNYADNKYDSTIHYFIMVLLDESKRNEIAQARMKEDKRDSAAYSDEELFEYLMRHLDMKEDCHGCGCFCVLDDTMQKLIGIAATAHALGNFTKTYQKKEGNNQWFFQEHQFHHEVARQTELEKTEIVKHLPTAQKNSADTYRHDFSENTIYHPREDLKKHQDRFKKRISCIEYSPQAKLQPYQLYLSGSLQPESKIWEPGEKQQQSYEELDEDFRHIECSPNLQVVRILAWAAANLDKLNLADVRIRINELLFQYGKLDIAFTCQLETTMLNLEHFLAVLLKYCTEEASQDTELLVWATNLAHDFRYYLEVAAKLYNLPIEQFSLPSFQELLLSRIQSTQDASIRSRLASQVIRGFRNNGPLTVDSCCLLLTCRIAANLGDEAGISDEAWENINEELLRVVKQNQKKAITELNRQLAIYTKLNSANQAEWRLVDSKLQAKDKNAFIDIRSGCWQTSDVKEPKERTLKTIADNKELFARLHLTPDNIMLLYSDNSAALSLQSADAKWEFLYSVSRSSDVVSKFSINTTYQTLNIEGVELRFKLLDEKASKEVSGFFKVKENPFESSEYCEFHYQYWQLEADSNSVFVRQQNSDTAYCYVKAENTPITQLILNKNGEWKRTDKLLLNLNKPQTLLEKSWAKRLGSLFGVTNVRCTALLSKDKSTCRLERIEHLSLGLNFTVNSSNQLICDEMPEYYLSNATGFATLHGLSSVIVLQNNNGDKKYLIPAFSLKGEEANHALNHEDIVDYASLCNKEQPYYSYTFDPNHGLVGESVAANLYLAILYRSQGDFVQAVKYLERSKTLRNINSEIVAIALQVLKRPIISPMGAAFDLKLACYLQEHQEKWAKDKDTVFEPVKFSDDWDDHIKKQFVFYNKTFSGYKQGVVIIPSCCRLTTDEIALLNMPARVPKPNGRLEKASRLPDLILQGDKEGWRNHVDAMFPQYYPNLPSYWDGLPYKLTTWRMYADGNTAPAFHYLLWDFYKLFKEAVSNTAKRLDKLYKILFSLLQNDADPKPELYELIALLVFACKHSDYFQDFVAYDEYKEEEIIKQVGEVLCQHHAELKNETIYLLQFTEGSDALIAEKALPVDFVAKKVSFEIAAIKQEQVCKHPLGIIAKKYFSCDNVPFAKEGFALDLVGLPKATLLEKRLFARFKKGHKENQKKTKAVYSVVAGKELSELKCDLKIQQQNDLSKLKELTNALKKANRTPLDDENASASEKVRAHCLLQARAGGQKHEISIGDLFTAFPQQKPELLTEQNPFLLQQDIAEIFAILADYALLHSRIDQVRPPLSATWS